MLQDCVDHSLSRSRCMPVLCNAMCGQHIISARLLRRVRLVPRLLLDRLLPLVSIHPSLSLSSHLQQSGSKTDICICMQVCNYLRIHNTTQICSVARPLVAATIVFVSSIDCKDGHAQKNHLVEPDKQEHCPRAQKREIPAHLYYRAPCISRTGDRVACAWSHVTESSEPECVEAAEREFSDKNVSRSQKLGLV